MALSAKVLHAGDGYTYLTREVAAHDVTRGRGQSLADYYTAAGAPPGRWMGSGLTALGVEGRVSEEQMKALFGAGLHPDAFARIAAKRTDIIGSQAWRGAYARALAAHAEVHGIGPLTEEAAREVAAGAAPLAFKLVEHRDPNSPEELAAWVGHQAELNRKQDIWHARVDERVEQLAAEKGCPVNNLPGGLVKTVKESLAAQLHTELEGEPARSPQDLAGWVERMDAPAMTSAQAERTAQRWLRQEQLGRAFPTFDTTKHDTWLERSKRAVEDAARERGIDADQLDADVRDQVLNEAAAQVFEEVEHRLPKGAQELAEWVQRMEEKPRQPVAGYDLVFTPPKSYSVLWALGGEQARRAVEEAHHAAVRSAMQLLESEVAFTRMGAAGIAQVETNGVVAAAFDHYDSRAGDPNLHTHFAVSNKVQGKDGRWRSIDGRVMHAAFVTVSTHYGAVVKAELAARLPGVTHQARMTSREKRPIYEIAGISRELCEEFSQRDARIVDEFNRLMAEYRELYGRDPAPAAQHRLAKQATLSTRPPKKGLESLSEKVSGWLPRALPHLAATGYGGITPEQVPALVEALARGIAPAEKAPEIPTARELADTVLDVVSSERSEWKAWHLRSEAARQIEGLNGLTPAQSAALITAVADQAVGLSIPLDPPEMYSRVSELERSNGESVYTVHGQRQFSSTQVFEAEERVILATAATTSPVASTRSFTRWAKDNTVGLSVDQAALVERFATSDRLLEVAAGAAGSGKSTAMRKLADLAREQGVNVRAAAPSAVAAEELGEKIDANGETLAKLLLEAEDGLDRSTIAKGDLVIVDEASMASTRDLDRLVEICAHKGARLRLLGDPYQLDAVEQGGLFRTLVEQTNAVELTTLHRFHDKTEAAQTLRVRTGDVSGLDWYFRHGRVHGGTREHLVEKIYADWRSDREQGVTSLMMVGDNTTAQTLSERARLDLVVAGLVERDGVELHNGSVAGVGDTIVTRRNQRWLRAARGYVKNGNTWTVTARGEDGSLTVESTSSGATTVLPAEYVAAHVELGYASTIHRAQGVTVDRGRILGDQMMGRNALYVGMTRGRAENHAYVPTEATVDIDLHHAAGPNQSARAVLESIIRRDDSARSAHDTLAANYEAGASLAAIVPEHADVRARRAVREGEIAAAFSEAGFSEEQVNVLKSSPAWHTLQDRVIDLTDRGISAPAALRDARDQHEIPLAEAEDQTAALAERLPNAEASQLALLVEHRGRLDVAETEDGTLDRALAERRARIDLRVDQLAMDAREAAWVDRVVGPEPVEETEREDWNRAVRYVAAYRDRYGVGDPARPLGDEPAEGSQREDWQHGQVLVERVAAAYARVQQRAEHAVEQPVVPAAAGREDAMTRLRRLAERAQDAAREERAQGEPGERSPSRRRPAPRETLEEQMAKLRRLRDRAEEQVEGREYAEDDAAARAAAEAEHLREAQRRAEQERLLEEQRRAEAERDQGRDR